MECVGWTLHRTPKARHVKHTLSGALRQQLLAFGHVL